MRLRRPSPRSSRRKRNSALLALEEEELALGDEEGEAEEEVPLQQLGEEIWKLPGAAQGAGQIRFAEDIMGEFRGGGRRDRKGGGRRGGQGPGGARKGGSRGRQPRVQVQQPK